MPFRRLRMSAALSGNPSPAVTAADVWWTPWPGTGRGIEVVGDVSGRRVVELGCGSGDNAAVFAAAGASVTAVDVASAAVEGARDRWAGLGGLRFVHSDAASYLASSDQPIDIVCSIFGALTFDPPGTLLPLIAARLSPGGLLATSHRSLASNNGDRGAYRPVPGHIYTAESWRTILSAHGLRLARSILIPSPNRRSAPCMISVATLDTP